MGKVVSKSSAREGRVRIENMKRSRNYTNLVNNPPADDNGRVVMEEKDDGDAADDAVNKPTGKQRKVDALLQLRKRPVSAFIHSGTDGLYVWFVSTWMRLKQKHYGKLNNSQSSDTSSRPSSRKPSPDNSDIIPTLIERTNSTESNGLDLADISDGSFAMTDSGRSSAASQENNLDDLDMYSIKYFNETVNDFDKDATQRADRTLSQPCNP